MESRKGEFISGINIFGPQYTPTNSSDGSAKTSSAELPKFNLYGRLDGVNAPPKYGLAAIVGLKNITYKESF